MGGGAGSSSDQVVRPALQEAITGHHFSLDIYSLHVKSSIKEVGRPEVICEQIKKTQPRLLGQHRLYRFLEAPRAATVEWLS